MPSIRNLACLIVLGWGFAFTRAAPAATIMGDCVPSRPADVKIAFCTKLLAGAPSRRVQELAHDTRGLAYIDASQFDRAVSDFTEVIRLHPDLAGYYDNRQTAYRLAGQYKEALADANYAIKIAPPGSSFVYRSRGLLYAAMHQFAQALPDLDQAVFIAPGDVGLHVDRGIVRRDAGDKSGAIADFSDALRLDQRSSGAYRERGLTYQALGQSAQALQDLSAALNLDPNDAIARQAQSELSAALRPRAPPSASPSDEPGGMNREKRVALVIGNSDYMHAPYLPNPKRDAARVAQALRESGFDVILKFDLTREQTVQALADTVTKVDTADWALIYYAGHGVEIAGANYLIPVDAQMATDRTVPFEAVPLTQAMDAVAGAHKLRLVILDACRANPFLNSMKMTTASRSLSRGLAPPPEADPGMLVAYAARDGEVAMDGQGDAGSPFATAFVAEMQKPRIELRRLFDLVSDDVIEATGNHQHPLTYGRLPGREDFFFRP